jgi:hypothetical protein
VVDVSAGSGSISESKSTGADSAQSSQAKGLSTGAIVGIVVGVIAVVGIAGFVYYKAFQEKKKYRQESI